MKYFVPGKESEEVVDLILSLVRVENEDQKAALYDHLCRGSTPTTASLLNGCKLSNFNRTLARVSDAFETFEKLFEIKNRKPTGKKKPHVMDTRLPGMHAPNIGELNP